MRAETTHEAHFICHLGSVSDSIHDSQIFEGKGTTPHPALDPAKSLCPRRNESSDKFLVALDLQHLTRCYTARLKSHISNSTAVDKLGSRWGMTSHNMRSPGRSHLFRARVQRRTQVQHVPQLAALGHVGIQLLSMGQFLMTAPR